MRRGRGRRQEPETAGLAPIPFSPNVGLAAVITACQPSEGLPTEHLPQRTAGGGAGGRKGEAEGGMGISGEPGDTGAPQSRAATQHWLCVCACVGAPGGSCPAPWRDSVCLGRTGSCRRVELSPHRDKRQEGLFDDPGRERLQP